jgi:hypothetical protein
MGGMSKPSLIVVLAEDERHQRFIRGYLEKLNYPLHAIRNEPLPAGRGAGEQWVRERYAKAMQAYRDRAVRAQTALVVVIDADMNSVARRLQQMEAPLAGERIARLVPKRNIETWILCLTGIAVDEETDYHDRHGIDEQIKSAAAQFFQWTRINAAIPQICVPSLHSAIPEVRRLE